MKIQHLHLLNKGILLCFIICLYISCGGEKSTLPYLGDSEVVSGETIYYKIPEFQFLDQDSMMVSNESLKGHPYVADFFFTSCPTICPTVKSELIRLRKMLKPTDQLAYLSMSIDFRKDSVPVLKKYAEKLNISSDDWHLVQLQKDQISTVANQYFNVAFEDDDSPGGFNHSGRLILVDGNGHIRSHCDGTDPKSVDDFAKDVRTLLDEG